jgi:hypothetical protein
MFRSIVVFKRSGAHYVDVCYECPGKYTTEVGTGGSISVFGNVGDSYPCLF